MGDVELLYHSPMDGRVRRGGERMGRERSSGEEIGGEGKGGRGMEREVFSL